MANGLSNLCPMNIVIVDDDNIELFVNTKLLQKKYGNEANIISYNSSSKFLKDFCNGLKFDHLILDYEMPEFNGYDVCSQISNYLNQHQCVKDFSISIISWHTEITSLIEEIDSKHIVNQVREKPLTPSIIEQVLQPCA